MTDSKALDDWVCIVYHKEDVRREQTAQKFLEFFGQQGRDGNRACARLL